MAAARRRGFSVRRRTERQHLEAGRRVTRIGVLPLAPTASDRFVMTVQPSGSRRTSRLSGVDHGLDR